MAKREWVSREHRLFRLDSGQWYARPSIPGVGRREFPLGGKVKTLEAAIRAKDRIIAKILTKNTPKPKSLVRNEDLGEEIIGQKRPKAAATLQSAELHIEKHLLPWLNKHYPYASQLNEAVWEEYVVHEHDACPTRRLFNDWKHMGMIARLAWRKGLINRPLELRNPDPKRSAGKRLTSYQVKRLYCRASAALQLQILMGVTMGMRKSEILKLTWHRVDMEKRTIHLRVQDTKIRKARTMGMSDWVYASLKDLKRVSPYVFPSRYDKSKPTRSNKTAWRACKRRAKVICRFHDLRHTFLSVTLLERKVNPLHVAVYAGVSLQEIQRTYLHPSVEDTRSVAYVHGGMLGENSK